MTLAMAMDWKRARCDTGSCVEIKMDGDSVYMRSSVNHQLITMTKAQWDALTSAIKAGEFDQ